MNPENTPSRKPAVWNQSPVEGVKRIIAVASGKGGVGKSTTCVQLALALQRMGLAVGVLDADIYGPSVPRMLGLSGQPEIREGKMVPSERCGVKAMSIGLIAGDVAAVLRGPMITKSLTQMLRATDWGTLDVLLVDMPPGTGDVTLSLAQSVKLDGVLIVTTPQEVAVMDARKSLQTFEKLNVPVLGVVENMSYLTDSAGQKLHPFGEGGGKRLAQECGVAYFGEVVLDPAIGTAAEAGEAYGGEAYRQLAERLPL